MVRRLVAGSFVFAFLVTSPGSDGGAGLAAVRAAKIAAPHVATGASLPGATALVI
ncbi:MAG: hypothetical protein RJB58_271 [Pseudomonadota bacterium]|jgi:hypothetical protein